MKSMAFRLLAWGRGSRSFESSTPRCHNVWAKTLNPVARAGRSNHMVSDHADGSHVHRGAILARALTNVTAKRRVELTTSPDFASAVPDRWFGIEQGEGFMTRSVHVHSSIAHLEGAELATLAGRVASLGATNWVGAA
jgi:hypothetical protein